MFCDDDFVFKNKFDECVHVKFPVYMYSYVKFVKLWSLNYHEYVSVKLFKEHC